MGGKGKAEVEVTDYYLSIHYAVCVGPVDAIERITVDKKTAWEGSISDHSSFRLSKRDLFGGNKKEGGLDGIVEYMPGKDDQTLSSSLANRLGLTPETAPAYRGITSLFFSGGGAGGSSGFSFLGIGVGGSGFYWRSNSPYLPGTWVKVRRSSKVLEAHNRMIGNDSNPAHILYELLTDTDWGMGAPAYTIDTDSFLYAAQVLFDEGFGISLLWSQQDTIEKFATTVINHIEGMIYYNPITGLLTLKLIRDDYNPDELFTINPDNAVLSKFQRKLWGETSNEVIVSWTNPETEETETVTIQDIGNIAMQGGVVSSPKDYKGVRNADLAMRLANRDIRVESSPLASCEARVDRSAWSVTPGSCVKVNWPEHGMNDVIMRVGTVDYGTTADSKVNVQLVEDIFSLPQASYTVPPSSEWLDPSENPRPLAHHLLMTANYYISRNMSQESATAQYPDVAVVALGSQTGSDTTEFSLDYEDANSAGGAGWIDGNDLSTSTRAVLDQPLTFEVSSTVALRDFTQGSGFSVGSLVVMGTNDLDMEMCIITELQENLMRIRRGVLDTIPREWPADTPVWFINPNSPVVERSLRVGGQSMTYRLLPRTSRGQLPVTDAPDVTVQLTERPWLPHRPANVRLNGVMNGEVTVVGGVALNLTWANRNRLMEDSVVLAWDEGNVTPEEGQTSTLIIRNEQGTEVNRLASLAGNSLQIDRAAFLGLPEAMIELRSSVGSLTSLQGHELKVILEQIAPGHRYWRLFFPEGALSGNYVQLTDVNFWTDYVTMPEVKVDTSPANGTAMASSTDGAGFPATAAFDSDVSTSWCSNTGLANANGQWIGFHFNTPKRIATASARTVSHIGGRTFKTATLQWSDDGTTWTDSYPSVPWRPSGPAGYYGLVNDVNALPAVDGLPHKFWRYRSYSRLTSYIQISRLRFMLAGVEKSIGGTATASSVYSPSYPASAAFASSGYWCSVNGRGLHEWIRYEFTEPTLIDQVIVTIQGGTDDGGDYLFIDYSDDGVNWRCAKFLNVPNATSHNIPLT